MKPISKKQYIKFTIASILYALFIMWMNNAWLLLGFLLLIDIYLTKFIPWGAWKKSKNKTFKSVMSWIDDIFFALIAVYFINTFFFQNYQIPSSSLEKSLLVGDYLFVSKLSYGPRVPNTPISFPLVQNTLPIFNCKSYLDWPSWDYKRVKGTGVVKRNDIVVFNFPAGDTVALNVPNPDYYTLISAYGRENVWNNKATFGDVVYRPVDKRDNYVKRCVGMPGDSLQIINNSLFINGVKQEDPLKMQLNYFIITDGAQLSDEQFRLLDVSKDERDFINNPQIIKSLLDYSNITLQNCMIYNVPLTKEAAEVAKKLSCVKKVVLEPDAWEGSVYPLDYNSGWSRDNYGPIWIPRKGETIELNAMNLALYNRCIVNYENNKMEIRNGKIFINEKETSTYTFKYDYYWMMGDNRHRSADSRSWGFVPEDHIVGKPLLIWLSIDKDRDWFDGHIRWNRMFRKVKPM